MPSSLHPLLAILLTAFIPPAAAQVPSVLQHSIPPPFGVPQANAQLGYSVAVDAGSGLTVAGAPFDDIGENNSGVVKVFDSTIGTLLFVLANPSPADDDRFGTSVAISGSHVVVGAYQDDTGASNAGSTYVYDLSSSTPTVPVVTLNNPSLAANDYFGWSVAISGSHVVVGTYQDDTGASNAGSVYVYELDSGTPTVPVVTLNNPSPTANDYFGWSVAISGNRVVVGSYGDDTGASNAGSVYVYELDSGTPTVPAAILNNPSPAEFDDFGTSVAISGSRVVVGSYGDDTGATNAGSVYVYALDSGTPTVPVATLNNPSPAVDDRFGTSVAISGIHAVAGACQDDTGASNAGSAYVYDLNNGTSTVPTATLNNPSPAANDSFGTSVAISGSRLVVGAPYEDTGEMAAGSAYVYDLRSSTPTVPVATLNNPSPAANDYFGASVAISGTRVVVGAYSDDTSEIDAGSAYVYDLNSSTPTLPVAVLNNPSPAESDSFGVSVAISGTRVVVGAFGDDISEIDAGSAYVYDLNSGTPTVPVTTLNNPSPAAFDYFGWSVAISGSRVVVGAQEDDTGEMEAGSAYVYDLNSGTSTVPTATLNNPSPAAFDNFGWSVAISGTRVVVGSYGDDTGETDAGCVYVYDISGDTPNVPVVSFNHPIPEANDVFGTSVAISGSRVVVGAFQNDTGGMEAGSTYVYDLNSGTPTVPVATLNNPSPEANDVFGSSVAISGSRVAVTDPADDTVAANKGYAYVFGPVLFTEIAIFKGTVSDPELTDNTGPQDFGSVNVGSSSPTQTFTIRNNSTVELSGIAVTKALTDNPGDFNVDTTGMSTILAPNATTTFTVTFAPASLGARSVTLEIASNDTDLNPFLIQLTGTCQQPPTPQKPVMVSPGPQYHHVGQAVNLLLVASDNPAKFSVKGLPKGLRYHATSGSIVGTPTTPKLDKAKQPMAYPVKIRATNSLGTGNEITVDWTILPLPFDFGGSFSGMVAPQAQVNDGLGGSISITVTSNGVVTGKVWVGGELQSFKGTLSVASGGASAVLNATIPNKNPVEVVTLELRLEAGQIVEGSRILRNGDDAGVTGWQGQSAPSMALQGRFHAALEPLQTGENIPEGAGWAVLNVSSKGVAAWSGRLADGSVLTASHGISAAGNVPFYAMLYKGSGAVRGWTQVNAESSDLDAPEGITWIKNAEPSSSKGRIYKNGIPEHTLSLLGGRYGLNEYGMLLDFDAPGPGIVRFTGGGLLEHVEQTFELSAKNTASLPKGAPVKISVNPKTGLFSTSFNEVRGGKAISVKGTGLLVPSLTYGVGYILVPQGPSSTDAIGSGRLVLVGY